MEHRFSANRFFQPSFSPGLAWVPEPDVLAFHRALPGYAPTPLHALPGLARELGVKAIWVKDESERSSTEGDTDPVNYSSIVAYPR